MVPLVGAPGAVRDAVVISGAQIAGLMQKTQE